MLTQKDLNVMGCGTPDCKHDHSILFVNSNCHPGHGVDVCYHKDIGAIRISCFVCEKYVTEIKVAEEE
jgi:hypothetical protein